MNLTIHLPGIALRGTLFIACGFVLWSLLRHQSAERLVTGGRTIVAAALLLAAGEFALCFRGQWKTDEVHAVEWSVPPLPQQRAVTGDGSAALLTEVEKAPLPLRNGVPAEAPASSGPAWSLSPRHASLVSWIWLAGAGFILTRWMAALAARRRMVRGAVPVEGRDWTCLLDSIPGGHGVRLLVHPQETVPCAWGHTVLLPADSVNWPPDERLMVLAHECAHLQRHDSFWLAAGQWFLALQWFNPLAWGVVRRIRLAGERAADDAVLGVTRDAPAYADLLVAFAKRPAGLQAAVSRMACPSTVCRRVECLLAESMDRRNAGFVWRTTWCAVALFTAAAVFRFTPAVAVAAEPPLNKAAELPLPPETGPVPETDSAAAIKNTIENTAMPPVQWKDVTLSAAITQMHDRTGVDFILRGDGAKTFSLELPETPLRDVIRRVCEATGMQYEVQPKAVIILPAADSPSMETRTFRIPEKGFGVFLFETSTGPTVKEELEKAGIVFREGAMAVVDKTSRRLIAKNTPQELERIGNYLETGSPDTAFVWSPVDIGGREYIAAGQVRRFYRFRSAGPAGEGPANNYTFQSPQMAMEWKKDDSVIRINGVKFVLSQPIREQAGDLWVSRADLSWILEPVLRPSRITGSVPLTTVILDPGHGGQDSGAVGLRGMESLYTLDTAQLLKAKLEAAGWTVIMTRNSEVFVPRSERVAIANRYPDAVFVSIHFNSAPSAPGMETFLLNSPGLPEGSPPDRETDELRTKSIALATALHANCLHQLRMQDRGIAGKNLDVLAGLRLPGLLMECGNLADAGDAALIADGNHRDKLAAAMARGLENYRRAITGSGRSSARPGEFKPR